MRHPIPVDYPPVRPPPEEYYPRRQVVYEPEYVAPPRERVRPPYRELPPHRMPDYYNTKYEDEAPPKVNMHCGYYTNTELIYASIVKTTET